jgi:tetratricopeptide (TPR) repeat protein
MAFHTLLGQAQLANGQNRAALETLERARELAPRNIPVTVRYAEALLQAGRPKRAHEVLLDLFNNVAPTQEQIRLTAIAANAAGDVADAYSYMAEYHIMGGDLPLRSASSSSPLRTGTNGQQRASSARACRNCARPCPRACAVSSGDRPRRTAESSARRILAAIRGAGESDDPFVRRAPRSTVPAASP